MATIKDVAKLAEVSVTTVSRVLNNRGYISDATKQKVHDAMKQLNYQPNEIARSLYRRKSNILGIIVPSVSHPFFAELTNYVEFYAYQAGYKVLICNSYSNSTKEQDYIEMIQRNQVDGFIIGSYTENASEYINSSLPIVTIDRNLSNGVPFITSDNYHGGLLATNLLIEKGCKKIAHISGPLEIDISANRRSQAFLDIVSEKNIDYIIEQSKIETLEGYGKLAQKIFIKHPDIDGIFAGSDLLAFSLIYTASSFEKKIPKDLKIVGYDDIDMASMSTPSLTTIRQDIEKIGKLAVKILIDKIEKKEVPIKNVLPVSLIERKTT